MKTTPGRSGILLSLLLAISCSAFLTGCQTTIGGQTLPSPDYLTDDVQYFPAGPEFKLSQTVQNHRKHQAMQSQMQNP